MQLEDKQKFYKSWVEVSKKNLIDNLDSFRGIVGKRTKILFVVKANAYCHGLEESVRDTLSGGSEANFAFRLYQA
jgi:alanine racemase